MSVKIRLRRMGAKNDPFFRIVAADSRSPNIGRFIETIGWYDPKKPGVNYQLEMDRLKYWEDNGAEVSDTVASLAKRVGQDAPVSKKAIKKAAAAELKAAEAAKAAAEAAAAAKAEAEAAAKAEAEAAAQAEAEAAETPAEEAAAPAEAKEEAAPAEEAASEEPKADQ